MTDIVEYDGYQGAVRYENGLLHIRILHIEDSIAAACSDAGQVQTEFQALVDDYRETCQAVGKEPSRPFKGSFNVRIDPDIHRKAAMAAASNGMNLNSWIAHAVAEKLRPAPEAPTIVDWALYAQAVVAASSRPRSVPQFQKAITAIGGVVEEQTTEQFQAVMLAVTASQARH